uniref:Uncharacterized protein n=1 Tax=Anopheles coluzzii TaxID=1518534 RepID=A0A8W7PXT0_ANOCL
MPLRHYYTALRTAPLLILAALQQYTTATDQQQQQQPFHRAPDTATTACNGSAGENGRAGYVEQQQLPQGKSPNTFLLHCCCVIVQITPVAPGRSHVTTTASAKKPTIGDDGGGGAGGGGGGGASGRTPVCRCNAQYKLQDLKALAAAQQKQQKLAAAQSASTSAINAIGTGGGGGAGGASVAAPPLQGILAKSSTTTSGHHAHRAHQPLQQQHSSQSLAYSSGGAGPPQPPPRQSQELSNEELIKFLQQINADIKWIEQLQQYKYEIEKSTSTDKTNARNINKPTGQQQQQHQQSVPPLANGHLGKPKSEPLLPTVAAPAPSTGAISKTEFFDRNLKQRHSSRSVDASTARRDEEAHGKEGGHQRHSSGPSDLQLLKSDISEWLLNLPLKKSKQPTTTDWIQYPLRQLKKHTFDPATQSSCTDVRRKEVRAEHGHSHRERKLRHSASEVVTSSQSDLPVHSQSQTRIAPAKPERTFRYHSRERAPSAHSAAPTHRQHSMPQIPLHQQQQPLHFQYPPALQPQPSTSTFVPPAAGHRSVKKERSRRHRTQRSATVGDINQFNKPSAQPPVGGYLHHPKAGPHARATAAERSASLTRCADPSCSVMSLCDDPTCYLFGSGEDGALAPVVGSANATTSYYDTPRCASLPRVLPKSAPKCGPLCYECNNKCNSLPRCTDARCQMGGGGGGGGGLPTTKAKSNSLPRNAAVHHYPAAAAVYPAVHQAPAAPPPCQPALRGAGRLSREESRCSLPRSSFKSSKKRSASASGSGSNGSKLTKSLSAASLNSRRRRHKTVHFGENLLREVCQNRKLIQPLQETPSGSAPLQPNIQMLYNFVEGVLSAWVDDEDDPNKSGPESEPERGAVLKPMHRCNRARFQTIRRVVNEAAELKGSSRLGNSRYRHRHWRGTAKDCNERFLRKFKPNGKLRHTTLPRLCTVRRMHSAAQQLMT